MLNIAQLVECLSSISKALNLIPSTTKADVVAHTCDPSTKEDQKFKVSLAYVVRLRRALVT